MASRVRGRNEPEPGACVYAAVSMATLTFGAFDGRTNDRREGPWWGAADRAGGTRIQSLRINNA